jgi:hypothetical protein
MVSLLSIFEARSALDTVQQSFGVPEGRGINGIVDAFRFEVVNRA